MFKQVAISAVTFIPVVGDFQSEVLNEVGAYIAKGKHVLGMKDELKASLDKWAAELSKINRCGHSTASTEALESAVRTFKGFVDDWKPPRRFKERLKEFINSSKFDDFLEAYHTFETKLRDLQLLLIVEIHQTIIKRNEDVLRRVAEVDKRLSNNHKEMMERSDAQRAQLLRSFSSVRRLIEAKIVTKTRIVIPQMHSELQAYRNGSNEKEKCEMREQLLKWVTEGINPEDALEVSLAFIQDDNEKDQGNGWDLLVKVLRSSKTRENVLQDGTLNIILEAVQNIPNSPAKVDSSTCLQILLDEDPAKFLEKYKSIDPPITDEKIFGRIIRLASSDDCALTVLRDLAVHDECKSVIAKMGGVEAMVKIYKGSERYSIDEHEAAISIRTEQAINVLASLATDETCRAKFAEKTTNIWPLVHFIRSNIFYSTVTKHGEVSVPDWSHCYPEDGVWSEITIETDYQVLTRFGKKRCKHYKNVKENETKAGNALWDLSSDSRCHNVFLELGTCIDLRTGELSAKPSERAGSYHPIMSWLKIGVWIIARNAKNSYDIGGWEGYDTKTESCFHGVAWNLLSSPDVKLGGGNTAELPEKETVESILKTKAPKIFDTSGDNQSSCDHLMANCKSLVSMGQRTEKFWLLYLLLNMLDWEIPSLKSSKVAELAAQLMAEGLISDRDVRKRFTTKIFENSRASDMDVSWIAFLVGGYSGDSDIDLADDGSDSEEESGSREDDENSEGDDSDAVDDASDSGDESGSRQDDDGSEGSEDEALSREEWFDDEDGRADSESTKCLIRLAYLWPDHNEQIVSKGGKKIAREVRRFNRDAPRFESSR